MSKKFDIGRLVATASVHEKMASDPEFLEFVNDSFLKYITGDWGDTSKEDAKKNDEAIENEERILAEYRAIPSDNTSMYIIWIITERDRKYTTILFPSEH